MAMLGKEILRNKKSPKRYKNLFELSYNYLIYAYKVLHGLLCKAPFCVEWFFKLFTKQRLFFVISSHNMTSNAKNAQIKKAFFQCKIIK